MYSLKSVHEKISVIKNTSSTNDKIKLLEEYLEDIVFREVITLAYSENTNFYISNFKHPFDSSRLLLENSDFEKAKKLFEVEAVNEFFFLNILKNISSKSGITNEEKLTLNKIISIDRETYNVISAICSKDLSCGINVKSINKAFPNLINTTPYQRCSTMKHFGNIDFNSGPIIQCKANGMFAYMIVDWDNREIPKITFKSRSGSIFKQLDTLINKILKQPSKLKFGSSRGILSALSKDSVVLMGELRVFDDFGEIMNRQEGNGILTSCLYGTANEKYLDKIFYTIWDIVPLEDYNNKESSLLYSYRFFTTSSYVNLVNNDRVLRIIPFEYVKTKEEANNFYLKMLKEGEEGAIIKNRNALWKDNTSTDMIKMKPIMECDMKIVGVTKHLKKSGWMGALELESSDGKVKCLCGSGFTEDDRGIDWKKNIGKIVSIETEGLIQDKKSDIFSLYLPVFIEIRNDKRKANSLKEIQEIELNTSGRKRHV